MVDKLTNKIIGAGSLIVEPKFIRNAGLAGHIEDIVVNEKYRGKHLGLRIIELLQDMGWANHCYKIILNCNDKNVGFY